MNLGTNQQWKDMGDKRAKTRYSQRKIRTNPVSKVCEDCNTLKPVSEFHKRGRAVDGYASRCKPCTTAYRFRLRPEAKPAPRGEQHYRCKLTDEDVRLILSLIEEREALYRQAKALSNRVLGEKFEVSHKTIEKIAVGLRTTT